MVCINKKFGVIAIVSITFTLSLSSMQVPQQQNTDNQQESWSQFLDRRLAESVKEQQEKIQKLEQEMYNETSEERKSELLKQIQDLREKLTLYTKTIAGIIDKNYFSEKK